VAAQLQEEGAAVVGDDAVDRGGLVSAERQKRDGGDTQRVRRVQAIDQRVVG
jgi:hypothetical protein